MRREPCVEAKGEVVASQTMRMEMSPDHENLIAELKRGSVGQGNETASSESVRSSCVSLDRLKERRRNELWRIKVGGRDSSHWAFRKRLFMELTDCESNVLQGVFCCCIQLIQGQCMRTIP